MNRIDNICKEWGKDMVVSTQITALSVEIVEEVFDVNIKDSNVVRF